MSRRSARQPSTETPDVDLSALNLEGEGAERVTQGEVDSVLGEIFGEMKKENQAKEDVRRRAAQNRQSAMQQQAAASSAIAAQGQTAAASATATQRQAAHSPANAPRVSTGAMSCVERLDKRLKELVNAAVELRDRGDADGALKFLQQSDELSAAVEKLLTDFPSPTLGSVSAPASNISPEAGPSHVASASPSTPPVNVSDDPFAHIISLRVVEFESKRLAGDEHMLIALDARRKTLEALEARRLNSASLSVPAAVQAATAAYLERLDNAIEDEKARSRQAKVENRTSDALNALRRAKLMVEEKEEIEGNGIANNPILTPVRGAEPLYQPRRPGM